MNTGKATIAITADVARYQAELAKIPGMTDKAAARAALKMQQRMQRASDAAAKEVERATKKAAEANSGLGQFQENAELFERMRASLGPFGDSLADITGGADDLATALGKAGAKKVALVAGMVALAAAAIKAAGAVADVLMNVDEYADNIDRLQGRGLISAEDAQQLRDAGAALGNLGRELTDLAVSIASTVAPAVKLLADGLAVIVLSVNTLISAASGIANFFLGAGSSADAANSGMKRFNKTIFRTMQLEDEAAARSLAAKRRRESELADARSAAEFFAAEAKREAEAAAAAKQAKQELAQATKSLEGLIVSAMMKEHTGRDKITAQYDRQIEQIHVMIAQHPELARRAQALIELYEDQRTAAENAFDTAANEEQRKKDKEAHEQQLKEIKQIEEAYAAQQAAMMQAKQETINATLESASSVAGSIHSALDSVIAMMDTSTASGKKAARQMAATQKALAIFQIGINMATSISQALAQGGPVAGAAMAAAVVAAFAGIMAEVQRPIPQFHTGRFGAASGMLGDESMTGGVVTVSPEVVIPPDLVSRSGGADGVRSRLEGDRPMIVQAVIDLTDERIVLPLSRALSARERGRLGIPLGRTA